MAAVVSAVLAMFAANGAPERLTTIGTGDDLPAKGYNIRVNSPVPPRPAADDRQPEKPQHRHTIYAAEASGLLLIAVLLLVLTVIRYWQYIPWSAR